MGGLRSAGVGYEGGLSGWLGVECLVLVRLATLLQEEACPGASPMGYLDGNVLVNSSQHSLQFVVLMKKYLISSLRRINLFVLKTQDRITIMQCMIIQCNHAVQLHIT